MQWELWQATHRGHSVKLRFVLYANCNGGQCVSDQEKLLWHFVWVEFLCETFTKQSKPNEHSLKQIACRWIFNIPRLQRHFEYTAQRTLGAWRLNVLCFSLSFLRKVRNNRQLLVCRWQLYCMLKCFVISLCLIKFEECKEHCWACVAYLCVTRDTPVNSLNHLFLIYTTVIPTFKAKRSQLSKKYFCKTWMASDYFLQRYNQKCLSRTLFMQMCIMIVLLINSICFKYTCLIHRQHCIQFDLSSSFGVMFNLNYLFQLFAQPH